MEFVRINATMPSKILRQLDEYAERMQEDRSTAIRQLVAKALFEEKKESILRSFSMHRLSMREAADALGMDYWDFQEFLAKAGVPASDLTAKEIVHAKQIAGRLAKGK